MFRYAFLCTMQGKAGRRDQDLRHLPRQTAAVISLTPNVNEEHERLAD
jgi:hypothetical protein